MTPVSKLVEALERIAATDTMFCDKDACVRWYREQAAEALSQARGMEDTGWRTMESALKGQKVLLGYHNAAGNWCTVTGRYYPPNTLDWHDDADPPDGMDYAPEGWYEESETHEDLLPTDCAPTRWQPLPPAPKGTP